MFIHYGTNEINKRLKPIKNAWNIKPRGGLWCCEYDVGRHTSAWRDWCIDEGFNLESLDKYSIFNLSDNAVILELSPDIDLFKIAPIKKAGIDIVLGIDYEKLAREFDAIHFPLDMYPNMYTKYYGVDIDSYLIMNGDVIEEVK